MPYATKFVMPGKLLVHKGVKVYRLYKNDDKEQGALNFSFTTNPEQGCEGPVEGEDCMFDARELSTWQEPAHPPYSDYANDTVEQRKENQALWDKWFANKVEEKAVKQAIKEAIAKGEIKAFTPEE